MIRVGPFLILGAALVATLYWSSGKAEPLRLGGSETGAYEVFQFGEALGHFEEEEVVFRHFDSLWDVTRALADKEIDAAVIGRNAALRFLVQGVPVQLFTLGDTTHRRYAVVAQSGVNRVRDLVGNSVGIEGGTLAGYLVGGAIARHGVPLRDVTFVHLSSREQESALTTGRVAAVITTEPVSTRLVAAGARVLLSSRDVSGEIVDLLVAHDVYAEEQPKRVDRLRRVWSRVLRHIGSHPTNGQGVAEKPVAMQ